MGEVSQEKYRIHLIMEGNEEEYLFDIVQELGVSDAFELTYENACGFGNVASLYQRAMFLEDYDSMPSRILRPNPMPPSILGLMVIVS